MILKLLIFSVLVAGTWSELAFPPGFKLGAATSSYQNEGAWNVADKSENIWDRYFHTVKQNESNADVTTNSYFLYKRDVQVAAELGLQFYRFSISWSRLLPTGFSSYISEDGTRYYNNLINELLKYGIEPVVTIHHFDLPQVLDDLGGWTNPQISDWFADYSRVVYSLFGDRVKTWLTINEPIMYCYLVITEIDPTADPYKCTKNILLAHAKSWRIYNEEFKPSYNGEVSIVNHLVWFEPDTEEDQELAELARQYCSGLYSQPIYSDEGGWPKDIELALEEYSLKQGYSQSVLPELTEEEIDLIRGTYDFYAFNYYTSRTVRKAKPREKVGEWPIEGIPEFNAVLDVRPDWEKTIVETFAQNPEGLRYELAWLKQQYGDLRFFVAENGYPTNGTSLEDEGRIRSIQNHLEQILIAVDEGANVEGYTVWSLIDTFEFTSGYEVHFGLYKVDFDNPLLPRTPRQSAYYYRNLTDSIRESSGSN